MMRLWGVWAIVPVAVASWADGGEAQTALPSITVDAPKSRAKKRVAVRPAPVVRRAAAVAPTPAPGPAALPRTADFASVTTLTSAEATARASSSLGDALGTKPGISATSFSPVASRPVIRGLGGFRVRTQENGIGSHDMANLGEDHAVTIDPLAAGNVEVVRGPATLRYGSQAIGGVVSASNNRIPTLIPPAGIAFESKGGVTSVNRGYDGAAQLDAGGQGIAIHADAFAREGNDYRIPGGVQANSSFRGDGHAVGASRVFADGFVGVAYQTQNLRYFIPGIDSAAVRNNIDLRQEKWTSRGEWRIGDYGLDTARFWLGASQYRHNEINGTGADAIIGSRFRNRENEARAELSHLPIQTAIGVLRGDAGISAGERRLSVLGADDPLLAPARARNAAAYLFEELQFAPVWRLQAAGRIESVAIGGTGAQFPTNFLPPPDAPTTFAVARTFAPTSASVGLLRDLPNGFVARVTAQHVERAPDPVELFYKGPHDTPRTFEIGSPGMTLEKADTVEAGLKRAVGDLRLEASLYATRYRNFIFKNFTGIRCGATFALCGAPGASYDQIIYSQRDANFIGGEVQVEKDIAPVWRGLWGVEFQYDFVRATFTEGGFVPKIPPHRAGPGLYYRDAQWQARVHYLHAFAQNRLAAFETRTPGYDLLNAEISYTARLPRQLVLPEMTVGLRGENLLNAPIRLHQSYKKDEVLQPGLNVRLFASVKLN